MGKQHEGLTDHRFASSQKRKHHSCINKHTYNWFIIFFVFYLILFTTEIHIAGTFCRVPITDGLIKKYENLGPNNKLAHIKSFGVYQCMHLLIT